MKHYFTKALFLAFLVFSQVAFFSPLSAAPYNNNLLIQQQAQAAQAQRDAQMAAERARRNAQIAADQAKNNARISAERARKDALRTTENTKRNAKNIANQNLLKNQRAQNARIQQKTTQDLQKQRAMERVQKNIQNQKQKVANDNQRKIKQKLSKLKRIKQLKNRDRNKKQRANKEKQEKKGNNVLITQTLNQKPPQASDGNKAKASSGGSGGGGNKGRGTVASGGGKKGNGNGNGRGSSKKVANEAAKLVQIKKNQSSTSVKDLNRKINSKVPKSVIKDRRAKKIFGHREGHLPDTPQNRKLLQDVANDPKTRECSRNCVI